MTLLAYFDYPEWRGLVDSIEKLNEELLANPKKASSLIVLFGGCYSDEVDSPYLSIWNGLTGTTWFITEIHAIATQVKRGLRGVDEMRIALLKTLVKGGYTLLDLILANNYLKLVLDLNLYDLGIIVFYENPESVAVGVREPMDLIPNKIFSTEVKVETEKGPLRLNLVIARQYRDKTVVVDWSNPGVVPYTRYLQPRVDEVEASDPIFTAFALLKCGIVSKPTCDALILTLPKPLGVKTDDVYCVDGNFVALPQSMGLKDFAVLTERLRGMGFRVIKSPHTRVDELILDCLGNTL